MNHINKEKGNVMLILVVLVALLVAAYYFIGPDKLKSMMSEWGGKDTSSATTTDQGTTGGTTAGTPVKTGKEDLIIASNPKPNQIVTSPLKVTGEARGTWYFEASFPVRLLDANGKELFAAPAQAKGDWMTQNFVPFEVSVTFATPETATGTLVLQKDNPSGMPENEDALLIPVRFK